MNITANITTLDRKLDPSKLEEAKKAQAARDLESYFIFTMMKEMRKTIHHSDLMGDDHFATDTYYQMMDEQMAKNMAENGGFGLSKQIMQNMFKQNSPTLNKQLLDQTYKGGDLPNLMH